MARGLNRGTFLKSAARSAAGSAILGACVLLMQRTPAAFAGEPAAGGEAQSTGRPRLLVLTDIGGDPDDQQALVRLMTHANEFEIEGLIASASGTPGELKKEIVQPDLIREIVRAYGQVLPNLSLHATGYPAAEQLLSRIKSGNPKRGWERVGEGHDTEFAMDHRGCGPARPAPAEHHDLALLRPA